MKNWVRVGHRVLRGGAPPSWLVETMFEGRRIRTEAPDESTARTMARSVHDRISIGLKPFEDEADTVAGVLNLYHERHAKRATSQHAIRRMADHRNAIVRTALGARRADDLTLENLLDFREERLEVGASYATSAKDLRHLKTALAYAMSLGKVNRNVFLTMTAETRKRIMPQWKRGETAGRVIPDETLIAILSAMPSSARRFALFARATGLRKREIATLHWQDHWRLEPVPGFVPITQKKSRERFIPWSSVKSVLGERGIGLVFRELGSSPKDIYWRFTRLWAKANRDAGVDYRPHDLRHTYGTTLRRSMSLEDTADAMGISAAIASTYASHERSDLMQRAAAAVVVSDELLGVK